MGPGQGTKDKLNGCEEFKMPIQINEENDGKSVAVRVTGRLVSADYELLVPELDRLIRLHGKLRLLFELNAFEGWQPGALWDECNFDMKHFSDIQRVAIVGDKEWEHGMATFYKPFTEATIRYFDRAHTAEAWKWWREPELPAAVAAA
jgi:hypothetical protein